MQNYVLAFKDSYSRVASAKVNAKFFDRFYELFLASDESIATKFDGVDLDRQKQMLKASLTEMTLFFVDHNITSYMRALATVHSKSGRNIEPQLYDRWLDAVIAAVNELDPYANEHVELAWRLVLAPGIAFMKFQYDK